MTALLLPGLAAVVAALLALGPVAWAGGPRLAARGALALCGLGAALALVALLAGMAPTTLELPIGLPGSGILLALDGLSALFLLLLFVPGAACAAAAMADDGPAAPLVPMLLGTLAATLLAADGFSVTLAFEATGLATACLVLGGGEGARGAAPLLGGGVAAGLCLIAAMALLAPLQSWGLDLSFAGMRARPPEGFRATAVLVLMLLGAGGAAGLAPLHRWVAPAQAAVSGPVGALLSGAGSKLGLYLLLRVLFDLAGPAQPGWWGGVLVAVGAAGAVLGAARAVRAEDIRTISGAWAVSQAGFAAIGFGLALAARAADLAPLAALALGAALLAVLAHGLGGTLLALALGAAEAGGGTRRLDRLGGLLRPMPLTCLAALVGAAGLAALPPAVGFAAAWTLFQALIGAARAGGLGWQALVTLATLGMATSISLGAVAAVRLVGVAFLGRPRTPRAAAAAEVALPARAAMLGLATLTLLAGVLPGLALGLAAPALRLLAGMDMADRAGLLGIVPQPGAAGLAAAAVAVLLVALTVATLRLLRVRAGIGQRGGPAWEGGAAPPPPWLPFGDAATQIGPTGFAEPLGSVLAMAQPRPLRLRPFLRAWYRATAWADAALRPSPHAAVAALFVAAVLLLAAIVLAAQA